MESHNAPLRDDLLNGVTEIAEHTGETRRRVYYLLEKGLIPGFQIGKRWYARKSALQRAYSCEAA